MRPTLLRSNQLLALSLAGLLGGCAQQAVKSGDEDSLSSLIGTHHGPANSTGATPGSIAEAMAKGDAALAAGNTQGALLNYTLALSKDANHADAYFKIGAIQASQGNDAAAEIAYRRALTSDAKHAAAMTGLGILLTRKRDYAAAEAQLRNALRLNPQLPGAHNALGVLADIDRDYARAQMHYQDGLALAPNSPTLHNNLGYSHYLAGNYKVAIAQFREALAINPNYTMAWRNLGLVYSRQGRYDEALTAFNKVQDLPQAYNDVGYIAMIAGRLEDAQSFFDEALRRSPEFYPTASQNAQRVRTLKGK